MKRITVDPVFRIHKKSSSGAEIFIHGFVMNSLGPVHYFSTHDHARNFCRYLFSQSKAHQKNHLTPRNVVCEYGEADTRSRNLDEPEQALVDFMSRRFPRHRADEILCDDGAYVAFAILTPEGHLVSNVVSQEGERAMINAGHMMALHATEDDVRMIERMALKATRLTDFEREETPSPISLKADRIVQRLVSERMGFDPLLSVSHRDQLDHNQCYHIHRLIRRVPPEDVEFSPS